MTVFDAILLLISLCVWGFIASQGSPKGEVNIILGFLSEWSYHVPFWILLPSIALNLRLKYRRHKFIFEPIFERKKEERLTNQTNAETSTKP